MLRDYNTMQNTVLLAIYVGTEVSCVTECHEIVWEFLQSNSLWGGLATCVFDKRNFLLSVNW